MKTRFHAINDTQPCYLIAELSHNHQADANMAIQLVGEAAKSGANAVKFQKRNNASLFSASYLQLPYTGPNSFGKTYGEHREVLEPKLSWLLDCRKEAHQLGLDFIMTVFDIESLEFCERELEVDAYKIQSGDLNYPDLIRAVAATNKPYFISCGAATLSEIKSAWNLCKSLNTPFIMMYAVSAYPTKTEEVNLSRFKQLKKVLDTDAFGFSCHYQGIEPAILVRALGCVAIEKHFTLDRGLAGPDHLISLLPAEWKELVSKLAETDRLIGHPFDESDDAEVDVYQRSARNKMCKAAVAIKNVEPGEMIQTKDVRFISPASGINPQAFEQFWNKQLIYSIKEGEYFSPNHFEPGI